MIKLYSTHCPRCIILEEKLASKDLKFETNDNIEEMLSLGIKTAPVLEVNNVLMTFAEAIKYINSL